MTVSLTERYSDERDPPATILREDGARVVAKRGLRVRFTAFDHAGKEGKIILTRPFWCRIEREDGSVVETNYANITALNPKPRRRLFPGFVPPRKKTTEKRGAK